jgi:hypothetical protein
MVSRDVNKFVAMATKNRWYAPVLRSEDIDRFWRMRKRGKTLGAIEKLNANWRCSGEAIKRPIIYTELD